MESIYDLLVIGAGPGGYEAACLAGKAGLKTALIEKKTPGGVCLNQGCIPFKSYLHIAGVREEAGRLVAQGLLENTAEILVNQKAVYRYKNAVVKALGKSMEAGLKNAGVSLIHATAFIQSVEAHGICVSADGTVITGKKLLIATGSREVRLLCDRERLSYPVVYSDGMLEIQSLPENVFIVGAGVIGLEAADYFHACGCKVTVIESGTCIGGGNLDQEIADTLLKCLARKGITFYLDTTVAEFQKDAVMLTSPNGSFYQEPDFVMIAVGRKAATDGLGLAHTDIAYDEDGIKINAYGQTTNPSVYACGDVTGKPMLAHAAIRQADIAVAHLSGKNPSVSDVCIPAVIYTNPEALNVGLSEECCRKNQISYVAKSLPMTYSGKYFAEHGKDPARAKMIADADTGTLLGFHMVGNGAAEIALAAELMMTRHMTVREIRQLVFPHPAVGEIIRELAGCF